MVVDGGTLEHVFDYPTALRNAMRMVRVGGHLILNAPVNNFPGHGFYQISPELFFRVLSPQFGFRVHDAVLMELYHPLHRWFRTRSWCSGPSGDVPEPLAHCHVHRGRASRSRPFIHATARTRRLRRRMGPSEGFCHGTVRARFHRTGRTATCRSLLPTPSDPAADRQPGKRTGSADATPTRSEVSERRQTHAPRTHSTVADLSAVETLGRVGGTAPGGPPALLEGSVRV